jgi:hypothetical protein
VDFRRAAGLDVASCSEHLPKEVGLRRNVINTMRGVTDRYPARGWPVAASGLESFA